MLPGLSSLKNGSFRLYLAYYITIFSQLKVYKTICKQVLVRYRGALPDLFREGHSVVAEGFLRPIDNYPGRPDASNEVNEDLVERAKKAGCYFAAVDVLAKHDEVRTSREHNRTS